MYDLIIIGGGAAGLFAAANSRGLNTLLLEKMPSTGKKILISGGGMCNLTNSDEPEDFIQRFGSRQKANFLKPSLLGLTPERTIDWFENRGLALETREDGKVFPQSQKATDLVSTLYGQAADSKVKILCSNPVSAIDKKNDFFTVTTDNQVFKSRNVLLATGGKSFASTGSDGSGYSLARSLGHRMVEPTQALVPLLIDNYPFYHLSGSSLRHITVDFYRKGEQKRYLRASGDLLFTHKGLSGPVILNNSRLVSKGDILKISLLPGDNREELRDELSSLLAAASGKTIRAVLKSKGIFTALNDSLLEILEIPRDKRCGELSKKVRNKLITSLLEFSMTVSRKGHFTAAMATAGGVSLEDVDRKTMESRLVSGLYFSGEVLDLDGDTGGYNIQAAFSTAFCAVEAIKRAGKQAL